jgi:hypothetical protein
MAVIHMDMGKLEQVVHIHQLDSCLKHCDSNNMPYLMTTFHRWSPHLWKQLLIKQEDYI